MAGLHHRDEAVAAVCATISGGSRHEISHANNLRSHALIGLATVANHVAPAIDAARGASRGAVFALAKMNLGHVVCSLVEAIIHDVSGNAIARHDLFSTPHRSPLFLELNRDAIEAIKVLDNGHTLAFAES